MFEDLLKTGKPDERELVDDDQQVGSDRLDRPDPTGLKGSRHSRLADHIQAPDDDLTLPEAETLCGEVTRAWLGDFAPALILLDAAARRRLQAVLTLTRTAVDFALQPGVEGERVSALNRLHFEVEAALDGEPRGQPAHLVITDEEARQAWDRPAWDALFDRLRHLAMLGALDAQQTRAIGGAIARLLGNAGDPRVAGALATVIGRAEEGRSAAGADGSDAVVEDRAEAGSPETTAALRRFAAYVAAAERKLRRRRSRGRSTQLGLLTRLGLLLRARLAWTAHRRTEST